MLGSTARFLVWMNFFKILFESVEPFVPELAAAFDPTLGLFECFGPNTAQSLPALLAASNQPGLFQNVQVLRHCRLRHVELASKFHHRAIAVGELLDDPSPRRIGQGLKDTIEPLSLYNHLVIY